MLNFSTSQGVFFPYVRKSLSFIEPRTTLPILSHFWLQRAGDELHLASNDAELEFKCKLKIDGERGVSDAVTIPARKLHDILKGLEKTARISIEINEVAGTAFFKTGRSKYKLQTLPGDDFPTSPELIEPKTFKISQQELKNLLSKTSFCVAVNDVRYYLTGLLLEIEEGKISLIGTDGHRMAVAQHDFESEKTARVIIPRKAVLELLKLLTDSEDEVKVSVDENHIQFELSDSYVMNSKLIDGNFPDWHSVVPLNPDKLVVAEKTLLKNALSRASILSNEKYKGVRLALTTNLLTISAKNAYQEEAEEIVEVEYSGDELEIGFNGVYLLDAVNAVSTEKIRIGFTDANGSIVIVDDIDFPNNKFIVMPMRL